MGLNLLQELTWRKFQTSIRVLILPICAVAYGTGGGTYTYAQTPKTCIPGLRGTPGFANSRPNWFDSTVIDPHDYQPNLTDLKPFDPRWVGAASHDFGASSSEAEFLGLSNVESGTTYLYLSWYLKISPQPVLAQTTFYVGFMPAGNNA